MRKPVRKVRRCSRKPGKGQGKQPRKGNTRLSGKGITAFVADLTDDAYDETFFGKGRQVKDEVKVRPNDPQAKELEMARTHEEEMEPS